MDLSRRDFFNLSAGIFTPGIEEWPLHGFVGEYDPGTWQYAATQAGRASTPPPSGPPFDPLVRSLLTTPPPRDETLQHPRTVFRIVKRHFSRYKTPTDGRGIGRHADIGGTVPTRRR